MSSLGGPSIVTSGLVLHLDAANVKSFKGEPTVNLITNPIPTSTSNFVVQGGIGTSTYDSTINAVRWVRTSYETWGAFYHNSSLANYLFDTTATYSISFKWKYGPSHSATYSTYFNIIQDNGQNTIMGNYVLTTYSTLLSDGWYYFKTSGIPANPGITQTGLAPGFRIITGSQSGITDIYWKNLQFEKKTYSTPFVNGTRGTNVTTGGGWLDRSGNGNHGEVINGPTYNSLKGGSIVFDGSNDYLSVLSSTSWALTTSSTVSIWCNPTNSIGHAICFDKGSWLGWYFSMSGFFLYCGQAGADQVTTFGTMTYGVWQNLTVVVDREGLYFKTYKNGVFVAQTAIVQPAINYASTLYLGCRGGYDNFHNGKTSNLHLYNRALSATEVLQNYNATKSRFI